MRGKDIHLFVARVTEICIVEIKASIEIVGHPRSEDTRRKLGATITVH
jgi:hypothetical protein